MVYIVSFSYISYNILYISVPPPTDVYDETDVFYFLLGSFRSDSIFLSLPYIYTGVCGILYMYKIYSYITRMWKRKRISILSNA